jgi:hypothetical protein
MPSSSFDVRQLPIWLLFLKPLLHPAKVAIQQAADQNAAEGARAPRAPSSSANSAFTVSLISRSKARKSLQAA